MYCVGICEDNSEEREYIKGLCENVLAEKEIPCRIVVFSDTVELEREMESGQRFDLLLMDIEMEGRNGMDFARQLRQKGNRVSIIFTTAHESFLREGYSVQPIHYLLKPVSRESLENAIRTDRVLNHTSQTLSLRCGARTIVLDMAEIYYVESSGHGVIVHTEKGQRGLPFIMKKMAELLPADRFCRCHTSFMVNMEQITEIMRAEVWLKNGVRIPVGRSYYSDFQKAFIRYLNYGAAI